MTDTWARLRTEDRAAAIVLLSAMMVVLIGLAAFAVDLGWLWVNASRVQNAADAAALSGVTHLPSDAAAAQASAEAAARANGYPIGGVNSMSTTVLQDNRLKVTLTTSVDTFFLRVFGQDSVTISRDATAQYILPVPLGSPFSSFGANTHNFWGAIQGQYVHREHGDPYSTQCLVGSTSDDSSCASANPSYRPDGYYLGVEVAPGTASLTVQLFDAGFYQRPDFNTETGDTANISGSEGDVVSTIHYQLYDADTTPYDPSDNTPLGGCYLELAPEQSPTTYKNKWAQLCSIASPTPGIYVLQVWTSGPGGETNQYGVRAQTVGPNAKVYGLNDISIFANVSGVSDLYLAEIKPVHAGKILNVSFFDAGDAAGDADLTVQDPSGAIAPNCTWQVRGGGGSGASCNIVTTTGGSNPYNGKWIDVQIRLADDYTCNETAPLGCWWSVKYDYSASPSAHDRTTWELEVIGNPVRLIVGS